MRQAVRPRAGKGREWSVRPHRDGQSQRTSPNPTAESCRPQSPKRAGRPATGKGLRSNPRGQRSERSQRPWFYPTAESSCRQSRRRAVPPAAGKGLEPNPYVPRAGPFPRLSINPTVGSSCPRLRRTTRRTTGKGGGSIASQAQYRRYWKQECGCAEAERSPVLKRARGPFRRRLARVPLQLPPGVRSTAEAVDLGRALEFRLSVPASDR